MKKFEYYPLGTKSGKKNLTNIKGIYSRSD